MLGSGCATRGSVRAVEKDVSKLRGDVSEVRVAQDLLSSDLARVLAELRSLEARSTEAQQAIRDSAAEMARVSTRLQTTEDQLRDGKAPAGTARATLGVIMPAPPPAATPATPLVTMPPATPPLVTPQTGPVAVEHSREPAADEPAEQAYAAALNTFRAGEHGQAVLDFMDFIARYPTHALAPNAQYWMGNTHSAQGQHKLAIAAHQKLLATWPEDAKAPDALVAIANSQEALGDRRSAQKTLEGLMVRYPQSPAAVSAKQRLQQGTKK